MLGKIFVVATPIGNLKDITLRALEVLKEADFILAEDTRVVKKLLHHYQISKPIISFFEHTPLAKIKNLLEFIQEGKILVLLSDAGTPNLSDPGHNLIGAVINQFGDTIQIIPIPGASSLTALISVSHFSLSEFIFLGFPPSKKGREKFFKSVADELKPVILFESTHRILKTLEALSKICPDRQMILAKELTKIYEKIWRGSVKDIFDKMIKLTSQELKGEFVMALAANSKFKNQNAK